MVSANRVVGNDFRQLAHVDCDAVVRMLAPVL